MNTAVCTEVSSWATYSVRGDMVQDSRDPLRHFDFVCGAWYKVIHGSVSADF